MGNHAHLYGYEELCRSIYTRKVYAEKWGLDPSPDFDHFELWRDGEFVTNVVPEIHDGLAYRVNRYEDQGLRHHERYVYKVRLQERQARRFLGLVREGDASMREYVKRRGEEG